MEATTWSEADFGYFRGGGYSSRFVHRGTNARDHDPSESGAKDVGPTLQIAEGWTVKLPEAGDTISYGSAQIIPGRAPGSHRRCNGKEGPLQECL